MKRLGVYCGSFSPIHNGHIKIIEETIKQGLVDDVLIVPTGTYWHKNNLLPLTRRIEMIKLCNIDGLSIDTIHNNVEYTSDILDDLQTKTEDTIVFIVGADNLPKLHKWHNFNNSIKYDFVIVPRDGIDIKYYMNKYKKENYKILKYKENNISSSYILKNLDNEKATKDMIPKKVLNYLQNI